MHSRAILLRRYYVLISETMNERQLMISLIKTTNRSTFFLPFLSIIIKEARYTSALLLVSVNILKEFIFTNLKVMILCICE